MVLNDDASFHNRSNKAIISAFVLNIQIVNSVIYV